MGGKLLYRFTIGAMAYGSYGADALIGLFDTTLHIETCSFFLRPIPS